MKLSDTTRGILAILSAQIIWGIAGPLVKIALSDVPPFSLLFLRGLFTSLILFFVYKFRLRSQKIAAKIEITSQDKRDIFWAGFLGTFVNIALYFWGQSLTTVIDTWVIISTGTIFVVSYSYIFLKERLNKLTYLGVGFAFAGTLIIIGTPLLELGKGSLLGNVLLVFSTIAVVASYIITKKLMVKFDPFLLTFYFFLISLAFSFPLFLWEFFQNPYWLAALKLKDYAIIAYLIIGSSIMAYSLDNLGLKYLSASLASTIGYASTVIAISLSIIFLHEQPTIFFVLGTLVTGIGLFLAETRHSRHPLHNLGKK